MAKDRPADGIYIGEIISTADPDMNGSLKVYIPALHKVKPKLNFKSGNNTDRSESTFNCKLTTPFAGKTPYYNENVNDVTSGSSSGQSYGMWLTTPDPGTQVIVAFGMGNLKYGLILSFLYPEDRTHMIPGLAGSLFNYSKPGYKLPVTEKNIFDSNFSGKGSTALRPVHLGFAKTLYEQGLMGDDLRGASSSSSRRESPSRVFGILTPGAPEQISGDGVGPALPGNRVAGHQFIMDDGDINGSSKNIRLRTGGGNQILMDDVDGVIYFINKSGKAWMELDQAGGITIFGEGSVDIRSKGNFNLRADRNVNIEAGGDVNIKAAGDTKTGDGDQHVGATKSPLPPLGYGGNLRFESTAQTSIFSRASAQLTSHGGDVDINAAGRTAITGGSLGVDIMAGATGIRMLSALGGIHLDSTIGINLKSPAPISLTGLPILLNSTGGIPSLPATAALTASQLSTNKHEDWSSTPPDFGKPDEGESRVGVVGDAVVGGAGADLMPNSSPQNASGRKKGPTVSSIVSTMPTAEPYLNHAKSDALAHQQSSMTEQDYDDNLGPNDTDTPDGYTGG